LTHADLTLVRRDDLRPPFADLVVDVVLRNPASAPRWLLLSGTAGPQARPIGSAGVHSSELVHPEGVPVIRFAGNAPFAAARLPGGGELSLHGWTLSLWNAPPAHEVEVEIVSAAGLRIGGEPADGWLERVTWISDDLVPLAVELDDERRERVCMRV
jgi:hypothetical protein